MVNGYIRVMINYSKVFGAGKTLSVLDGTENITVAPESVLGQITLVYRTKLITCESN